MRAIVEAMLKKAFINIFPRIEPGTLKINYHAIELFLKAILFKK